MRLNNEGHSLFSSTFKAPSPTFFSYKYDNPPSSNSSPSNTSNYTSGDSLTRTNINKFENYLPSSGYASTSPERPPLLRTYSPSTKPLENSASINRNTAPPSPRLSSKFSRYFGRSSSAQPDYDSSNSTDNQANSNTISSTASSCFLPTNSLSRYPSLPSYSKNTFEEGRSSSPQFNSIGSLNVLPRDHARPSNSYLKPADSPKFGRAATAGGSSSNFSYLNKSESLESTNPSSFLKLARLNLTPVKFRATKLSALESPRKDSADPDRTVEEDPGAPIPPTSNSPSTSAGASDATAPYTSAPAPPPEVGPLPDGGGDGGSSIGSSEGGGGAARKAATAFTIDLDKDDEGDDGEGSGKKLDIGGPLSKWAPPKHHHRRNLSLTKVEENKKVDERGGKPPVYRARCGTMGAPGVLQRRPGGYHSEGYFSSDQDEDGAPRKTDMRGPRTPEGLKSPLGAAHHSGVSRSASQDFNRHSPAIRGRPPSPDQTDGSRRSLNGGGSSSGLITLNESANFLIEKMVNSTPETKRKLSVGVRPGDSSRQCCKGLDKKPSVADITGRSSRSSSDKGSKASTKVDARKHDTNGSTHTNCQPFKVEDRLLDRDEDEVSEAGTYTIDKDSSPELDKGRGDIERVFGLASGTAEVTTPSSYSSNHWEVNPNNNYKTGSSISRNSPNWIQQWAAQVAEQTSVGDLSDMTKPEMPSKATAASPRGSKMSSSMSQDSGSDLLRPRRKLPTPPTHHLQQQQMQGCFGGATTGSSTHLAELELISRRVPEFNDVFDGVSKQNGLHGPQEQDGRNSDASEDIEAFNKGDDTQCFLRDTEQYLTSLQARVTDSTPITSSGGYQISSFESHDSGGDSDVDTSTSYATQDQRQPSSSTSLRNKLKLSGLESGSGPVVSKSRNVAPNSLINPRNASKLEGAKRGGELSSDGGYDAYLSQKEDLNNVHSDTSSETSEHLKDARKNNSNNNLNNPPLKYNRAFSLRRARLSDEGGSATTAGSSLPSTRQAPPTPTERRKVQQPVIRTSNSGGGSSLNSRRSPGTSSAVLTRSSSTSSSHQVVKSPSRSSISKKEATSSHQRKQHPNSRSNSTMSSKEVDFQNWKRRKNYDPMKAAKDAKKKQQLEKRSTDKSDNITSSERGSPSPPNSLLRSASFHGTEGMLGAPPGHRWPRPSMSRSMYQQHGNTYTSEDDGPMSYDDEQALPPAPHASPLRRSPTSPHQLNQSPLTNSPSIRPLGGGGRRSSCTLSDDSEPMHSSPSRKISIDDTGSEGKRSPLSIGQSNTSSLSRGPAINTSGGGGRSRTKIEALDNLVISTIHSLSVKVRGTSENLLQKLKSQYCNEDQDRAELLQSVLNHLNSESESATSQVRSTSRDLSGILKNLKKIQTALEVIDQVMAVGGADDDYVEDVDWAPSSSMGGASDY